MLKYRVEDVEALVQSIENQSEVKNRWGLLRPRWNDIVKRLLPQASSDVDWQQLQSATAHLWAFLAKDFLDKSLTHEYNSAKHGLRVESGGWRCDVGVNEPPGLLAPREQMRTIASSQFGSRYLKATLFAERNYHYGDQYVNWQPVDLARRIEIIVASTTNLLAILKCIHDCPRENIIMSFFGERDVEDLIAAIDAGSSFRFSIDSTFTTSGIMPLAAQEIRDSYKTKS